MGLDALFAWKFYFLIQSNFGRNFGLKYRTNFVTYEQGGARLKLSTINCSYADTGFRGDLSSHGQYSMYGLIESPLYCSNMSHINTLSTVDTEVSAYENFTV